MKQRRAEGYIALLSTLIVGAISLSIVLSVLLLGTASQQNSLVQQQAAQARDIADSCAEEALLQIQTNTAFTGSNSLSIGSDTCNYTVTSTTTSTRTITSTATKGNVVKKVAVYVTINTSSISITSWQETS